MNISIIPPEINYRSFGHQFQHMYDQEKKQESAKKHVTQKPKSKDGHEPSEDGAPHHTTTKQTAQLQALADDYTDQKYPIQKKNNTGLPDLLKSGIEHLSGYSMDDVKVHYNSDKPAQLQAHAYAQGNQIHIAPGQEKHLPHEAWHVVQQKQGRVKPTKQLKKNVNINDDEGLEKEADRMGALSKRVSKTGNSEQQGVKQLVHSSEVIQRIVLFDEESRISKIDITRPTSGLQSSTTRGTNYHIAAMQIGVDVAQRLIGLTYDEALTRLNDFSVDILNYPGFANAPHKIQGTIFSKQAVLLDAIEDARASNPLNYGANIELLLEHYIQTLDQLNYTYHEEGSGLKGGDGEGAAAKAFRDAPDSDQMNEGLLIEKSLKLVDIRNWKPSVQEASIPIAQALLKMMESYPFLKNEPYLVTAIINNFARVLNLNSGDLYRAVEEFVPINF